MNKKAYKLECALRIQGQGKPLSEIAKKLHMTPSGVSRLLQRTKIATETNKTISEAAKLITEILNYRDWSQHQLAEAVGVTKRTIQHWIANDRTPNAEAMRKLQQLLSSEENPLKMLNNNVEKAKQLSVIKSRAEAIRFIQTMQSGSNSTKEEIAAWELCENIVKLPFLIDSQGWIFGDDWYKRKEENCFAQIEKVLGAKVTWSIYCSYLVAYRDNERQIPDFLLDINKLMALACRAEIDKEKKEKFGKITLELKKRKGN
ncbi:MAG: helix-turn-helix transcriptional regulator [Blastocatellia bacterium]|nr:helix-turn-helix transcriptional regulator [Blastocatellia bacterium]